MLYFDHAGSTSILPEAYDSYIKSLREDFANSSAKHKLGKKLASDIDDVRASLYKQVFKKKMPLRYKEFILFTSSATESNNTILSFLKKQNDGNILVGMSDHPSLSYIMEDSKKCELKYNKDGFIDIDYLDHLINDETIALAFSHVNSLTGGIEDIEEICKRVKLKNKNVHIHLDLSQSYSKVTKDLSSIAWDSLTISGHKIGAGKGVSCLILKKEIVPLLRGGGQEKGLRSSTVNVPAIKSFGAVLNYHNLFEKENYEKVLNIQTYFINGLKKSRSFSALFTQERRSPYICLIASDKIPSDLVMRQLELKEIYVSTSTACSSKNSDKQVQLFSNLNIPCKFHRGILRISFSFETTLNDIDCLLKELISVEKDLYFI